MEEARKVIERLERIERLRHTEASAAAVLAEVRGLLRDGEAWLAAEGRENDPAAAALERCRDRVQPSGEVRPGSTIAAR
jgi:hypothetical protein